MKILFTGAVLQNSWPGGEPAAARLVENILTSQGIAVQKCFFPRNRPKKWTFNPFSSQSVLSNQAVNTYRHYIEKLRPDLVMTWYDYDLSALWASVCSKVPVIAQAQILWPVCPLSCLFNEVTESPCEGPNNTCGLCLARRARFLHEIPRMVPEKTCLPFTQLSMNKTNIIRSKLNQSAAVICDNRFLKKVMTKYHFDQTRIHTIYNGVNLETIEPSYTFKKPKTVLFLSNNVNRQKGYHHFIALSQQLKPEFPDARFLWVGQTDVQGPSFETLGYVWDRKELQALFKSSYMLLLPSLWPEAMSYSVIQAMASGKPVVAYDVGANSEGIIHGETGLLAEWGNIEQLSSHVRTLLSDEQLSLKMGRNARKRAEAMFSLKLMEWKYTKLIELIKHDKPRGDLYC
jgi:glycosyltransferase involved in cell wall biosynthesis